MDGILIDDSFMVHSLHYDATWWLDHSQSGLPSFHPTCLVVSHKTRIKAQKESKRFKPNPNDSISQVILIAPDTT
jgi:hypothetical protein